MKNLAVVNWGRDYHLFVGLARESIVAAFAIMAYNFQVTRTWDAMDALIAEKHSNGDRVDRQMLKEKRRRTKQLALPSAQPTMTTPAGVERRRRRQAPGTWPQGPRVLGRAAGPLTRSTLFPLNSAAACCTISSRP